MPDEMKTLYNAGGDLSIRRTENAGNGMFLSSYIAVMIELKGRESTGKKEIYER